MRPKHTKKTHVVLRGWLTMLKLIVWDVT